jgi:1,6-anhydro-N-acetylmuramate kinase
MKRLIEIYRKEERLVIGLMSGTSVDGIDAALVRIRGKGLDTKIELLEFENSVLPEMEVMTQEDMGFNSDAKEAVAFAILANEAINGHFNNIPKATGAKHPVVMGKICM